MRLVRYGEKGAERPGLWTGEGIIDLRTLFPDMPDVKESFFREGWLQRIEGASAAPLNTPARLGPPVASPMKIICVGRNYIEHVKEGNKEVPDHPLLFCKTPNALTGPFDEIILPKSSTKVDWEVELAVIIGKEGKAIPEDEAFGHIAGYTVMNDVSARDVQFGDTQWFRGKSFDTFAPLGPVLVTPDELEVEAGLRLTTILNGELMQDGNTRDMIFPIPRLISFISRDITLAPGDIIATGTPSGLGIFRDPPVLLKEGDEIACEIEGIGRIKNSVVA